MYTIIISNTALLMGSDPVYSYHRFTRQHYLYRHSSTLKTRRIAATKLCDVTSRTTSSRSAPWDPQISISVSLYWVSDITSRSEGTTRILEVTCSSLSPETGYPYSGAPPLSSDPAVKFPDWTSHVNNHPTYHSLYKQETFPFSEGSSSVLVRTWSRSWWKPPLLR
jgi:hypothetical protein